MNKNIEQREQEWVDTDAKNFDRWIALTLEILHGAILFNGQHLTAKELRSLVTIAEKQRKKHD